MGENKYIIKNNQKYMARRKFTNERKNTSLYKRNPTSTKEGGLHSTPFGGITK
jgi:hypothetical protein